MPKIDIDLRNRSSVIVGLKGSGKSVFARSLLEATPNEHMVYDPNNEYHGYRRYVPEQPYSHEELEEFIRDKVARYKPGLVLFDESNTYMPKHPRPLGPWLSQLANNGRHWGVAPVYIARRPSQLHTDIVEPADSVSRY